LKIWGATPESFHSYLKQGWRNREKETKIYKSNNSSQQVNNEDLMNILGLQNLKDL